MEQQGDVATEAEKDDSTKEATEDVSLHLFKDVDNGDDGEFDLLSGPLASGAGKKRKGEESQAGSEKKKKGQAADPDAAAAAERSKVAYSKQEAALFSETISAVGGRDESRLKCAADDVLGALNYVFEEEFGQTDRLSSQEAIEKTKSPCLSVWCEFLLSGEVSLNGKRIRAYSALRPELQHMCRLAKKKLSMTTGDKDPLAIARELTMELIGAPVQMLVEGEEDSHSRVAHFMANCNKHVAQIQRFIEETMDLPLAMHEVHIQALRGCVGKTMEIVDFLSSVHSKLESVIPTRWLSFATDVSDYYGLNGAFPDTTEQASAVMFMFGWWSWWVCVCVMCRAACVRVCVCVSVHVYAACCMRLHDWMCLYIV